MLFSLSSDRPLYAMAIAVSRYRELYDEGRRVALGKPHCFLRKHDSFLDEFLALLNQRVILRMPGAILNGAPINKQWFRDRIANNQSWGLDGQAEPELSRAQWKLR